MVHATKRGTHNVGGVIKFFLARDVVDQTGLARGSYDKGERDACKDQSVVRMDQGTSKRTKGPALRTFGVVFALKAAVQDQVQLRGFKQGTSRKRWVSTLVKP